MTDSIRTVLDLTNMSRLARMDIDATIGRDLSPLGEVKRQYDKLSTQKSPLTDAKTSWRTRTELIDGEFVPTKIEASLNIPNAVAGQNVVHGTSVFAAAISAFYLQKIWMAESGVPGEELDKLTLGDIRLAGVTLSYPQECTSLADACSLVEAVRDVGRALYGEKCIVLSSSNDTVYIDRGDYELTIYNKTDLSHCAFKEGTPISALRALSPTIVRIEVKLGARFLQKRGLTSTESWRQAYAEGRYEQLFNELVRGTLRLEHHLRCKAPRPEVFARLTTLEAHILRDYLDGRDPRAAKAVLTSARPTNRFYELRRSLIDKSQVDIDIPWALHKRLRSAELVDRLVYRGDFDPAPKNTNWVFSRSSWDALRETLQALYDRALANRSHGPVALLSAHR
jgi:hypothetical protein